MEAQKVKILILNLFLHICCYTASDSKNHYVFMFLSLLSALGVFITIEVGFLLVGHTHEDIEGTYGKMSSSLKSEDIYSLPEMMDTYCKIEEKECFHLN